MVGADGQWWQRRHGLLRSVVARIIHLYDRHDELHGDRSHERHELHVHGDRHEQGRRRIRLIRVRCCCPRNDPRRTCLDLGLALERAGNNQLGRTTEFGRTFDHRLRGR